MTIQSPPPRINLGVSVRKDADEEPSRQSGTGKQRLVIVSNRVADLSASVQSGGLAVGLADAVRKRGGIWFGWNGDREGETGGPVNISEHGPVTCVGIPVTPADFTEYYSDYSNSVLWPLFHYRLDLVHITATAFDGYMRVNEAFARQLLPMLRPDDIIWIHDYHLIPLASILRKMGCRQRIGFFLHIPFPPPELLSATPHHRDLVDGLLDYDVLGFQTHTDVNNLKSYLLAHKPQTRVTKDHLHGKDRKVQIGRYPIGIDAAEFTRLASEDREESVPRKPVGAERIQRIIGVDRLDYSKGLPERFRAFDELLRQHPELSKQVNFVQIAPPSRGEVDAYADIRAELEQMAGAVNGRLADLDWTPLQYICRPLPRDVLAPLMRNSDIGFVTPLRDGMNLVAKEFVAAQDPQDPGVLILSQFAGAAEEMQDALIVNPYDVEDMADALYRGLTMPLDERRARHAALLHTVTTCGARDWAAAFLADLTPAR
jgi:trehalose 6-phosphate synthase